MKTFRSNISGATIHVYDTDGEWFYKHCPQRKWLKKQEAAGPFKTEGQALLAACQDERFNFSQYSEVRP
jgi:hypothetical protein